MTLDRTARVFGVGMHRTGTTSLRRAFNILGFRCLEDEGCWFMTVLGPTGRLTFNPTSEVHSYGGFADFPVPLFYRELDLMFPMSKFILSLRDVETWLDSVEYIFSAWRESWAASPEWPLIQACHYGVYGSAEFDRQRARAAYDRHNEAVRTYFKHRPHDLLELDLSGQLDWEPLCRFLDVAVPDTPFPNLNARGA